MRWLRGWFLREVPEGGICPRGYGLAWRGLAVGRCSVVVCPLPINLLIGLLRYLYFGLIRGFPRHLNDTHGRDRYGRCCRCVDCGAILQPTAEERASDEPYG